MPVFLLMLNLGNKHLNPYLPQFVNPTTSWDKLFFVTCLTASEKQTPIFVFGAALRN